MDEFTLEPIYRIEYFLDAIVNGSENPYEPVYRVEFYLAKLAGTDVEIPDPVYRIEYYLAKLCGEDVEIPEPIYRTEFYLAAACGEEVETPDPIYRVEYWWAEVASALSTWTWEKIVAKLAAGKTIPDGVEFTVPHATHGNTDGLITFITRRCNVDKVHGDPTKPTCTIQAKYLLSANGGTSAATFQYDRPESPFPPLETAIPANTVVQFQVVIAYGSWPVGTYHFTPTADLPVGACLTISGYQNTALTSLKVQCWTDQTCVTKIGEYEIASGDGSATVDLGGWQNHPQRVSYGSNNEPESNNFLWLNTIGNMRENWTPQTPFDTMTTNFGATTVGFLGGFPEEFRAHLGLADIDNLTNTVYECPPVEKNKKITHTGKIWLASRKEIYGSNENANEADETQFPYFAEVGTTDSDKLMYAEKAASPTSYWLRTPYASYAISVRICYMGNGGALDYHNATYSVGVAPLAILVP